MQAMKLKDKFNQLASEHSEAKSEALRWSIYVNAISRGEPVSIVRRGVHMLQVVRHAGPEGGILAYTFKPDFQLEFTSIHSWEAWYAWAKVIEPTDKETEQLREAAFQMLEYVRNAQRKAGLNV